MLCVRIHLAILLVEIIQGVVVRWGNVAIELLRVESKVTQIGPELCPLLTITHLSVRLLPTVTTVELVVEVLPVLDREERPLVVLNVLRRNDETQLRVNSGSTHDDPF